MKTLKMLMFVAAAGLIGHAQQPAPVDALDGADPVVLLKEGKEVFGKSTLRSEYGRLAYLFSSAETKAEFDKAPEKYAVQLGGLCARMGRTVGGNPADYMVYNGKIYVFGSDACHKAFAAAPEKYIQPASAPMPADAAARSRGQAILDRAVAFSGGSAKLDAITSYVETGSEIQKRATGDVKVTTRRMWQFPGMARFDRTLPLPDGRVATFGMLLTRDAVYSVGSRITPLPAEALPWVQQETFRQIVPLLRARREKGVTVAGLAPATVDGIAVERVRVRRAGLDVTLNVDAKTGAIHSTTFIDRGPESQYGEITVLYSNFKPVEGLKLPFTEKGLFNGAAVAVLDRTIDAIAINAPLDAALFNPTAGGQ